MTKNNEHKVLSPPILGLSPRYHMPHARKSPTTTSAMQASKECPKGRRCRIEPMQIEGKNRKVNKTKRRKNKK